MTGFKSKKAAALEEEGRVFDKLGNKVNDDDDAQGYIAQYESALTIAYQSGHYDGKKAAQRTWVDLTNDHIADVIDSMPQGIVGDWDLFEYARAVLAKSKEKNA